MRNSLRMRPDRIIVGECRGSETLDMLQAMNTGHAGSMTTVHANTPRELLGRLETMVMMGGVELPQRAIREQIVMAIGCLVQLQRTPAGPPRRALHHRDPGHGGRHRPAPGHLPPGGHGRGHGASGPDRPAAQDPRRAGARTASKCRRTSSATTPMRCSARAAGERAATTGRPGPAASWSRPLRRCTRCWRAAARREVSAMVLGSHAVSAQARGASSAAILVGGGLVAGRRRPPSCGCARSSARWPRSSTTPWARPRCPSRS